MIIRSILDEKAMFTFDKELTSFSFQMDQQSIFHGTSLASRATYFAHKMSSYLKRPLFLAIHSIDGYSLYNNESQSVFSSLVAYSDRMIRIVASCDNVNIFDVWDSSSISGFQWVSK